MKVLFDTQIFDWQISGGISRYFIEVLSRLDKDRDLEVIFRCRHSYNTYIQDTRWLANKPVLKNLQFKGKLSALKIINQQLNRPYGNRLLKKGAPDIFHPTYYDPYFLKNLGSTPLVITVHDLTNERMNDGTSQTQTVLSWKKNLIEKASHIITVSENTRSDLIDYYHYNPEKVTTAHLSGGFSPRLFDIPVRQDINILPDRYLLFVGSRQGYKNFNAFIKEAAPLLKQEQILLIIAGGGPITLSEQNLINNLGIRERVIAYPHVSDAFLFKLYSEATVFVFPPSRRFWHSCTGSHAVRLPGCVKR
ncbi:MAG: glycosyltransferase [Chitinophagaceae bacterium]|nr:glycosyltransferase [Chitinophagaceae bacterium]